MDVWAVEAEDIKSRFMERWKVTPQSDGGQAGVLTLKAAPTTAKPLNMFARTFEEAV